MIELMSCNEVAIVKKSQIRCKDITFFPMCQNLNEKRCLAAARPTTPKSPAGTAPPQQKNTVPVSRFQQKCGTKEPSPCPASGNVWGKRTSLCCGGWGRCDSRSGQMGAAAVGCGVAVAVTWRTRPGHRWRARRGGSGCPRAPRCTSCRPLGWATGRRRWPRGTTRRRP